MKTVTTTTAAVAALMFFAALAPGAIAQDEASKRAAEADAVYRNGFVYTVDGVRRRAEAFAVRDGKIAATNLYPDTPEGIRELTELVSALVDKRQ